MIVQCKEEDVEKNGYWHTGSQTEMQHTDPVQYTVLGWVKKYQKWKENEPKYIIIREEISELMY